MEFLPTSMGSRPPVAVEVQPEGVVAARGEAAAGGITAVSRVNLAPGILVPGLRAGNVVNRPALAGAVRRALDGVVKSGDRGKYVTLVVPDVAVRVLLLDFDALPAKPAEALPVVRFRLKKLLPFEVEQSVVSYQMMSSARGLVQVLAVAIPCDVLAEYEGAVMDAGHLAGAVLPSTLAALAGLEDGDSPALVVNAGPGAVTTAIVRGGVVLLHRTVDLRAEFGRESGVPLVGESMPGLEGGSELDRVRPLPAPEQGRREFVDDEIDRMDALAAMQAGVVWAESEAAGGGVRDRLMVEADRVVAEVNRGAGVSTAREVAQAVSVAAAYFEDTLAMPVGSVLSAGAMGAEQLREVLVETGFEGVAVREMVSPEVMGPGAETSRVPRGLLAGVRGALKS